MERLHSPLAAVTQASWQGKLLFQAFYGQRLCECSSSIPLAIIALRSVTVITYAVSHGTKSPNIRVGWMAAKLDYGLCVLSHDLAQ